MIFNQTGPFLHHFGAKRFFGALVFTRLAHFKGLMPLHLAHQKISGHRTVIIDIEPCEFAEVLRAQKRVRKRSVSFIHLAAHLLRDAFFKSARVYETVRMKAC